MGIRGWVQRTLFRLGYDVQRIRPPESRWDARYLQEAAPSITTCIDVGVGTGTSVLYEAFPDAYHVLVEPLREYESCMKEILTRYEGRYCLTAAGAEIGTRTLTVGADGLSSSFLQRAPLTRPVGSTEQREVPITTLDHLLEVHRFEPPFGLKIDTEGYELQVLDGAPNVLKRTAFVIAEVSYAGRFEGGYSFSDFTERMSRHGFYLHEILQAARRPTGPILYYDALFLRAPASGSS